MQAWIGLGGNLSGSGQALQAALQLIQQEPSIDVLNVSDFYHSAPWGHTEQGQFINAVAELKTTLTPQDLLARLLETESSLGRVRNGVRWGPRLVDLDLLSYEDCVLNTQALQLPHPRMHLRAFVLVPLLQLDPKFVIQGVGRAVDCLNQLSSAEIDSVQLLTKSARELEK